VLNCLFRTSAGVSGISSPWSFVPYARYLMTLPSLDYLPEHVDHQEQQHEAEVKSHTTDPDGPNVAP
jgi:hypothetical protein